MVAKSLYPFKSNFFEIDAAKMHYVDEGQGPVVVLLHGNPTWSFYYRNLINALKGEFRVIAPDYIGCGLSDHPPDLHFRAADRIRQVEALLNALDIKHCSLVMHDWGGPIGTGVALRDISRIDKIVYLNTTLTEIESLPKIIKTAALPLIGKFITQYTKRFLKLTTGLGVVRTISNEIKEGYFYPYQTVADRTAIWDFVADIPFDSNHPTHADLVEISSKLPLLKDKPVQIIWGLKDPCFHKEMLAKVAAHFPQAAVLEFPDASHLVLEDKPEEVCFAIKQFLTTEVGVSSDIDSQSQNVLYAEMIAHAEAHPEQSAMINGAFKGDTAQYTYTKFGDLKKRIFQYERGLSQLGLSRGDRVLFLVPVGADFIALALAVMGRGAVPIFVDPGVGLDNLKKCVADAAPDVCISSIKGYLLRFLFQKSLKHVKFHLIVNDLLLARGATTAFLKKFSASPLPAVRSTGTVFIAFTSGGTGTPKGVLFTDQMLTAQLDIFRKHLGLVAGEKDMPLLPIFTIFHAALGVTSVIPPLNPAKPLALNPEHVTMMIKDLSVTSSFGSPTLWAKIADYCKRKNITLPSIKQILIAGAPVTKNILSAVESIIPNGEVISPYGATEALPVTVLRSSITHQLKDCPAKSGEQGILVGTPLPGCQVRIIAFDDTAIETIEQTKILEAFEIGEIIVKGAHVSPQYLSRPDANRISKIKDGGSFWHRMGDMGYLGSTGEIFFCGRKMHAVKTEEKTFFSIPTERIFNQHNKVKRSALVSLHGGREAAVAIEPLPQFFPNSKEEEQQFKAELKALAEEVDTTREISKFYFHPSFPVDGRHNAKIFRDKLSDWATTLEDKK